MAAFAIKWEGKVQTLEVLSVVSGGWCPHKSIAANTSENSIFLWNSKNSSFGTNYLHMYQHIAGSLALNSLRFAALDLEGPAWNQAQNLQGMCRGTPRCGCSERKHLVFLLASVIISIFVPIIATVGLAFCMNNGNSLTFHCAVLDLHKVDKASSHLLWGYLFTRHLWRT